jgi:hypothetical protein
MTILNSWILIVQTNEWLVPDLLRGRGKLIGGDLDIDNKASE